MRMLLLCRVFQLGDAYSTRCEGREERLAFLRKSVFCTKPVLEDAPCVFFDLDGRFEIAAERVCLT